MRLAARAADFVTQIFKNVRLREQKRERNVMNSTPDLSPLVKGVLALMGIAIALGQYPRLEHWARAQALEAVQWKQGLPYFFPASPAGDRHHHINHLYQRHMEGGRQ